MRPENFEEEFDSSENVFSEILSRYLPFWPLFLVLIICSLGMSFLYLRYATPIYQSSAKILVKDEKKGLDESKIMESLDLFGSKKIVENEIEVIKSVELTSQAVKNLRLYAPVMQEGRLFDASAYLTSPVLVEAKNPDTLREVKKKYFQYDFDRQVVAMDKQEFSLNKWFWTKYGTLRFVPNPQYIATNEGRPFYFSLSSVYRVASDLLDRMEVEAPSKQATIIYLTLKDAIHKRAENILDEVVTVYNKAAVEDKNTLGTNTLNFVNNRLTYVVKELDSVERQIQRYKNKNSIVDIRNMCWENLKKLASSLPALVFPILCSKDCWKDCTRLN